MRTETFIEDSVIEIEMLAELPDSYVRQPAEKLRLYRELDSIRREEDLLSFESRLIDRFGALPEAAQELLNVVRLRWEPAEKNKNWHWQELCTRMPR